MKTNIDCTLVVKNIFTNIRVLAILLVCLTIEVGNAWGAEGTTHDFSQSLSQVLNNGVDIDDVTVAEQSYTVKQVIVSVSYNKSRPGATVSVTVGGVTFGSAQTINSSTTTTFTYTGASAVKGQVVVSSVNNCTSASGNGTFQITNVRLVEGAAPVVTPYTVRFYKTNGTYTDLTEASAGAGVTPPTMQASCGDWEFQGWSTTESDDDESTVELATVTLTAGKYYPAANTTLYPVYTMDGTIESEVEDVITTSINGKAGTNTTYTAFSNKSLTSDAVYAGQSNNGNNNDIKSVVQLRNTSPAGIVTTASGGILKQVDVVWNSSTTNGRYITIFGKNTSYSGSTDLYDNSTKGTSLGTIVKNTSTQLVASDDYEYIGILANNALYMTSLTLTWTVEEDVTFYYSYPTCVVSHTVSSAVDPTGKATVTLGATSVAEDATTTATCGSFTAGYEFVDWSISGTGATLSSTTDNPTTITMGTANVTVTANLRCITPTFSAHPSNATYNQNASPTALSVTAAAGGASLSYQWKQCATADGTYTNVASSGTSSTYSPSTASLGTTYYKCVVTNAATGCSTYATSNAGSVTVKGTVTYDANGGTGTMTDASSPYASGATVTVKSNSFTAPAGKQFDHWDTSDDDTGTDYAEGATFTMSGNTTLYAQWVDADDCDDPSAPTASSVSGTGVTISTSSSSADYDIYYSTSSTTPTTEDPSATISSGQSKAITGLSYGTTYYYWMRQNCGGGSTSSWVAGSPTRFTTTVPAPTGLSMTPSLYGVTFSITDANNVNNYEIYYSTTNSAPETSPSGTATTTSKSKEVTGLPASTTYYCWVRAKGPNANSSWYSAGSFATLTLSSISVSTAPTKTKYLVGDYFDPTGLVITRSYSNSTSDTYTYADHNGEFTFSPATNAALTAENSSVTITYGGQTTSQAINVYSVTVNKVNMSGTAISNASVTATCSGRTLSQSVGSTNYLFNSWNVTAGGVTVSTNTITGTPTGDVTINAKFHDPITVTWKVGASAASGSPTTEVKYGTKISALPSTPADNAVASCGDANKFMGWTAAGKIEGTGHSAPADLFTTAGGATALTTNTTYRAVFATQSGGNTSSEELTNAEINSGVCSATRAYGTEYDYTDGKVDYSFSVLVDAAGRHRVQMKKEDETAYIKITAPGNISQVDLTITAASNSSGGLDDIDLTNALSATTYVNLNTEATTDNSSRVAYALGSDVDENELTVSVASPANKTLYLQTTGGACRIWRMKVYYSVPLTTKDYITGCCTPLDDLNGTVSWSDPTTAVVSWDNIAHVDSWTVEYKTGAGSYSTTNVSADEVYTKSKTDDSRKVTITGLACGTDYTFHIVATPAEDYCNKDQTINDSQLHKYAITLDPANGEVTGGSFIAYSEYECNGEDVYIEAEAAIGYEFAGWTITKDGGGTVTPAASSTSTTFEMPAKDVTVVASFDPLTYTITYYDGDDVDDDKTFSGSHASGYPTTHTYATETTLKSATKDSYDFRGWFDNKECEGDAITSLGATAYTANITLYAKWRPAGTYRATITAPSNGTITVSWNDGSAQSFTSGYEDIAEDTELTITGTPSTGYDLSSITVNSSSFTSGNTHTLTGDITVAASFSAHTYSITYKDKGGSDFTGTQAGAPTTHTYNTATTLKMPTRDGYTFGGWFTASNCESGAVGNTTSASLGATDYTENITLYAKWNTITYDITYEGLSGASNSNPTSYNIETSTITLVNPGTRTGYTFAGWTLGGSPITQIAVGSTGDKTITATWTINQYNVAVAEVGGVTITATPAGGSTLAEGDNANVDYNKTVTLAKDGLGTGIYWVGWKVTNAGGDDVTASVVSENTLTVPAYAVTVTAVLGKMKAWCMPEFEITGDVHLTSVKGVYVNTTSTTGDLLTLSGTNTENVTRITIDYLDNNGDVVGTKLSSPLRLRTGDNSTYAESDITSGFSTGTYEGSFSVRFIPTDYDEIDNYTLRFSIKKGSRVLKTIEHPMNGRALPEEFVIAVKRNDQWYALPNSILDNNRAITPLKISVDNATTPTAATYASTASVYKGYETSNSRYAAGTNVYGVRLTDPDDHWLQVSSSSGTNYVWVSESGSSTCQDWWLKSSDFSSYTLKVPNSGAGDKSFGINNLGNIGFFASDATNLCKEVYLLPITNKYTQVDATATDWTGDAIGVTASTSATKMGIAQDGIETSPVALNSVETSHVADFNGSIDFSGLNGKTILLTWYDGSDNLIGGSQVTVPSIVLAGDNDEWSDFASAPTLSDIVVLSQPMTIDEVAKAKQIVIDQSGSNTGKLVINADQSLIVDGKISKFADGAFGGTSAGDLAILSDEDGTGALITGEASTTTQATVGFYTKAIKHATRGYVNQYIGVPFSGSTAYDRFYDTYVYEYVASSNAWSPLANNGEMSPFAAYNLMRDESTTTTLYSGGTLVLPGTSDEYKDKELTLTLRNASATTTNMFANSYTAPIDITAMTADDFTGVDATIYLFNSGSKDDVDNRAAQAGSGAGQWLVLPVASVAASPGSYAVTTIPSQQAFMVKGNSDSETHKVTIDYKKHIYDPAKTSGATIDPTRAPKRNMEETMLETMNLTVQGVGGASDRVLIFMREDFSTDFDNGWDGRKMKGKTYAPYLYAATDEGKMAVNSIPTAEGTVLGFKAGTEDNYYTFSFEYNGDEMWYLNDLKTETSTLINAANTYSFVSEIGDTEARFVISATPIHKIATGNENAGAEAAKVRKLIIDDKVYIIRGGRMYSVDGQMIK